VVISSAPPPVFTSASAEPVGVGAGTAAAIGAAAAGNISLKDISRAAAREAERDVILRMLTRTRWNRKEAAEILGISYKALLYKIKENGLDKAS
jgi:DNA-binding NtrC family response regulator